MTQRSPPETDHLEGVLPARNAALLLEPDDHILTRATRTDAIRTRARGDGFCSATP